MTNNIDVIYVRKAFEESVYADAKRLFDKITGLYRDYAKTDDDIEKLITSHTDDGKKAHENHLIELSAEIEDVKAEFRHYLDGIPEKEVFEELIQMLTENIKEYGEKITLKKLDEIIDQRRRRFDIIPELKEDTRVLVNDVLEEQTEPENPNQTIISTQEQYHNKNQIFKDILGLLAKYGNDEKDEKDEKDEIRRHGSIEMLNFLEKISRSRDIDCELEPGLNLHAFAITHGFEDIVSLIRSYKRK